MRIEGISQIKGKNDRFCIQFDDGAEITVNASQIADFGIYSGRVLSEDEYERMRKSVDLSFAKTRALRILGNRNLSAKEMERRLAEKGESIEVSKETVLWLEENGLICDSEYAAKIVKHYSENGYGISRIREELFRRGIPRETWEDALQVIQCTDLEKASYDLIERKLKGSLDKNDLHRASNYLVRRGYSYEQARTAINKYIEKTRYE